MSTVFRYKNLRICVNTRDHHPPHVHVIGPGIHFRVDLTTGEVMDDFVALRERFVHEICQIISENENILMEAWRKYHDDKEES